MKPNREVRRTLPKRAAPARHAVFVIASRWVGGKALGFLKSFVVAVAETV